MNLYHLRVFLSVAEHEHITRAAEVLILSQPAVTKIIQSLEREVGFELIERHGRRIVLTHTGHILHGYALRLFALEREMEEALRALRNIEVGEVTLAANTTMGIYLLPPLVAHFRARYPRVELRINILNSSEIIEQILNWHLDFGLVEGDPQTLPAELHAELFANDKLILVMAPIHPLSAFSSLELETVQHHELLLRERGSGVREVIEQAFLQRKILLTPLMTLSDNEAIKQMVMSGVGVALVSVTTVQRELATGELCSVPIVDLDLRPSLSLVRRVDKQLPRAAQAFFDLIQAEGRVE